MSYGGFGDGHFGMTEKALRGERDGCEGYVSSFAFCRGSWGLRLFLWFFMVLAGGFLVLGA
jgi:hypothetical protein